MTADELRQELLRRGRVGPWQRIAAVAGDGSAIVALSTLLGAPHLEVAEDLDGVARNVEALAAARRKVLVSQVTRWPPPPEVADRPGFDVAWATALRHLPDWPDLDGAGEAVTSEADLLRLQGTRPLTWHELVERTERTLAPRSAIRWAGSCRLLDDHVPAAELEKVPFPVLRALRNKTSVLDAAGRSLIEQKATDPEDPLEAALAVELATELGLDVYDEAAAALLDDLDGGWSPEEAEPLAFVLLSDWRLP